jgi:hypothetical protein
MIDVMFTDLFYFPIRDCRVWLSMFSMPFLNHHVLKTYYLKKKTFFQKREFAFVGSPKFRGRNLYKEGRV